MPLYKPQFDHGGGGIVNPSGTSLVIKGPDGSVIYSSNKPQRGTEGSKWNVPVGDIPPGSTFSIDGGTSYTISDPGKRNEYGPSGGMPSRVGGKGSLGYGSDVPAGFMPGTMGYGSFPGYIAGMFPSTVLANYDPIRAAPYQFTDPMQYAKKFGAFNRKEIQKNFDQSKDLALNELNTELASLKHFVPAASALKRQEIALDNQFNQAQRTQQVNKALPGVGADLNAQAGRARAYAEGRIPDSVSNQAFELGIRSAAADSAAAGGFGASSSVARKSSDLLSATQRIGLSKYGDSLLNMNIQEKAALYLAPTEYSNAGSQISVMPSLSSSQLINSNLNAINGLTTITPGQGLQSTTQQNQFRTSEQQQTRMFNAQNKLQLSEFNAQSQNTMALDLFGYNAAYANSVAGASQLDTNTTLMLQQQQMYMQLMQQYMNQAQAAGSAGAGGLISGIIGGVGDIVGAGKGGGGGGGDGGKGGLGGIIN